MTRRLDINPSFIERRKRPDRAGRCGEAYAKSFPSACFELIPEAGHLPQIEQPEETLRRIRRFAAETTVAASV